METEKEKKQDILALLLGMGALVGKDIVVSLLISKGSVHFLECQSMKGLQDLSEEQEEAPLNILDEELSLNYYSHNYIG